MVRIHIPTTFVPDTLRTTVAYQICVCDGTKPHHSTHSLLGTPHVPPQTLRPDDSTDLRWITWDKCETFHKTNQNLTTPTSHLLTGLPYTVPDTRQDITCSQVILVFKFSGSLLPTRHDRESFLEGTRKSPHVPSSLFSSCSHGDGSTSRVRSPRPVLHYLPSVGSGRSPSPSRTQQEPHVYIDWTHKTVLVRVQTAALRPVPTSPTDSSPT